MIFEFRILKRFSVINLRLWSPTSEWRHPLHGVGAGPVVVEEVVEAAALLRVALSDEWLQIAQLLQLGKLLQVVLGCIKL